ncbi:hypothetical protein V8F06_006760 [Rhypophila decipiens]
MKHFEGASHIAHCFYYYLYFAFSAITILLYKRRHCLLMIYGLFVSAFSLLGSFSFSGVFVFKLDMYILDDLQWELLILSLFVSLFVFYFLYSSTHSALCGSIDCSSDMGLGHIAGISLF